MSSSSATVFASRPSPGDSITLVLRWAAFCVFISQAWIHFFREAPFRALLWNRGLFEPWVEWFLQMGWEDYAATSDATIGNVIRGFGLFYGLCAVVTWTVRPGSRFQMTLLGLGSLALAFLAFLKFLDHHYESPQLIEHTAQWATPLLLVAALSSGRQAARVSTPAPAPAPAPALELGMKIAIALAFTGHGFYAAGFLPVPGHFIGMTTHCLGLSEPAARVFLQVAGYLDFAVAVGIFLPRVSVLFLSYAAVWGALTSLARVVSHFAPAESWFGIDPWLAETLTRMPHALLPFALLLPYLRRREKEPSLAEPSRIDATTA